MSPEAVDTPKFSVCFSDLADFLGLKDEVNERVNILIEQEDQNPDESVLSGMARSTNS